MKPGVNQIRALDVNCPKGHALAGDYCESASFCQARLTAAALASRKRNAKLRKAVKPMHWSKL